MKLKLIALCGVGVGVAFAACQTRGPEVECIVGKSRFDLKPGSFATVYTLKEGEDPNRPCAQLPADAVGMQKYYPATGNPTIAIKTAKMGQLAWDNEEIRTDPNAEHTLFALGALAEPLPAADNFCTIPELSPARLELPALAGLPDGGNIPAHSISYEWSNVRIYNSPAIPGTQFVADVAYTEDGCTARYTAKGMWPRVSCRLSNGNLDETLCSPYPNPDAGRNIPSGINPLFPIRCEPVSGLCVLDGDVPSAE